MIADKGWYGKSKPKCKEKTGKAIASAFNKDVVGNLSSVIKNLGGRLGSGMEKHGRAGQAWSKTKGADLKERGAAKGGVAGGAMKLAGGGLEKVLGPILGTVGKLGPLLSLASGFMVGIVQLLIDAEAQAKDFQRELLSSASTAEFLAKAGGDATLAYADLADTVKDIRIASFNFTENMKWGTTAKDHQAFWNTLNQEGISIHTMKTEFKEAKKAGVEAGDASDYFSKQVGVAIGFSRNFGVTLTEIVNFESEMMRDLGMSSQTASQQFSNMAQAAADSGIAANKFFAIMRGVSSDLSLYNLRMEDAVGLLSKLGKAMSPKNAQKFMQSLAQGFKGMGRTERLRMTMLAGEKKTREIFEDDAKKREIAIAKEIDAKKHIGIDAAKDLVKGYVEGSEKGVSAFNAAIKGMEGEGTTKEAAIELRSDKDMSKKGTFGLSQAIGNMGITGMIKMQTAALGRFSKKGTLQGMQGELGPEMMAENLGISREQLSNMVKLETVMAETRKDMAKDSKVTAAQLKDDDEVLKYAGIDKKNAEDAMKSQLDFAKEQTGLIDSVANKIERFTQWAMNQLYNVLLDIYETISNIPGAGGSKSAQVSLMRGANASPEMRELLAKVGSKDFHSTALTQSKSGIAVGDVLENTTKKIEALNKISADSSLPEDKRKAADKEKDALSNKFQKVSRWIGEDIQQLGIDTQEAIAAQAVQMAGVAPGDASDTEDKNARITKMQKAMESGKDLASAAEAAGFNEEEVGKIMAKALWAMSPGQVADVLGTYSDSHGAAAPSAPGAAASKPSTTTAPMPSATTAATAPQSQALPVTSAASVTPAAPAVFGPPPPSTAQTKLAETAQATNEEQLGALGDLHGALRKSGIRIDKTFLKGAFGDQMEKSTLAAMREALFEFWLYQKSDKKKALKLVKEGKMSAGSLGESLMKGVNPLGKDTSGGGVGGDAGGDAGSDGGDDDNDTETAEKKSSGGTVVALHANEDGLNAGETTGRRRANKKDRGKRKKKPKFVKAAPGETLTSIGLDETILPAGMPQVTYNSVEMMVQAARNAGTTYRDTGEGSVMSPGVRPEDAEAFAQIVSEALEKTKAAIAAKEKEEAAGGQGGTLKVDVDVKGLIGPEFDAYLKGVITDAIYEYESKQCLGRT